MKKVNKIEVLFILLTFFILFFLIINTPLIYKYKNNGELIISEVMASNKTTLVNNICVYDDYIEIYNGYDYDINLEEYYLSDDNFNLKKWQFPNITIKSKSYLIVYASGKDTVLDGEVHTNFKLSKSGELLTLSDKKANPLSRIYFSETKGDTSYGYNGSEYVYYYIPTPGKINNINYSANPIKEEKSTTKLIITEYMKGSNAKIELYNGETYDINLENYYLSNDSKKPYKYLLPKVTIKANDYLVIYLNGNDSFKDNKIETNFILNEDDSILVLCDASKNIIQKLYLSELNSNMSAGYYNDNWYIYKESTFGTANKDNYIDTPGDAVKSIRINEVTTKSIELKNLTDKNIDLSNYSIKDKSGIIKNLSKEIKANGYLVLNTSDLGFGIGNGNEELYLYQNGKKIDTYKVGRLVSDVSSGINEDNTRVYYKRITMGSENSKEEYLGYALNPVYSIDGGYVKAGTKITLNTSDDSTIYYTLDGSMPSNKSNKYTGEIEINKTTVIKAISYKDNYLNSDIVSRTFIVGRTHDVAIVSISSDNSNFYGYRGIITNYHQNVNKIINFEFYESDGKLGTSFLGDTKLSGMDSREMPQKSMSIYLRKEYGLKEITYPFFNNYENTTYSSILLRNAGEDPKNIRIMDAVLTRTLKGQMDIDMQDYRPVVVYINGEYYGLYNLREKLNTDYLVTKFNVDKDNVDLIKYSTAQSGSMTNYNKLMNYVNSHDPSRSDVYEYIKSQVDVEELCNYWIVESYYGNTDLGNIRYWKSPEGKWRFMLYDLDWSMWNSTTSMSYPVLNTNIPAVTYWYPAIQLSRRLYRNQEYKDLYLKTLAYHLKNTFNPERMNKIVDNLAKEIENEMPYHIQRWGSNSMTRWHNNLNSFKSMISSRYNYVVRRLKSEFNLTQAEYDKYFKELK